VSRFILPLLFLSACDLSGEFLFAGAVDGVPGVLIVEAPEGGTLHTPALIEDYQGVRDNTIYFEVGPTGTASLGGATVDFVGTGGKVCVWVDPELVTWNQAIREGLDPFLRPFAYPDNVFDDGDIELTGGRSVFYTGSPGIEMGDFVLRYDDDLGNPVPVPFTECQPAGPEAVSAEHSGRAMPEFCEFESTDIGVSYTVALTTWSTPLDDDRLSVGVILSQGDCADLLDFADDELGFAPGTPEPQNIECVIRGEGIEPSGDAGPWYGADAVADLSWENSVLFEDTFCGASGVERLDLFCENEAAGLIGETDESIEAMDEDELEQRAEDQNCAWQNLEDGERCFCGDPRDTPQQGAG